jgi:hypothetical protein
MARERIALTRRVITVPTIEGTLERIVFRNAENGYT